MDYLKFQLVERAHYVHTMCMLCTLRARYVHATCFMIDRAGPKSIAKSIGETVTQPLATRKKMEKTKKKWVDDFTVLASVDLKEKLELDPAPVRPLTHRGRHEQILPRQHNLLQDEVDLIVTYSKD